MADDKKISELNAGGPLTDADLLPVVQSGETVKITGSIVKTYIGAEPADVTILKEGDVDDVPVDGATTAPVSSNWAYDHTANSSAHNPVSGQSDIGADLADTDNLLVYDTSIAEHKKSALSRFWTYVGGKLSTYTGDLTAKSFSLNQNITSTAWTTSGVRHKNTAVTLTDTSSSGIVAEAYTNVFSGNTIAASNATVFTDYATAHIAAPTAGTNVTIMNPYALSLSGNQKIAGGTVTASAPVLDISQTWNNAEVAFTGIKANITNTASNAASKIIDWKVNGVSRFSISPLGAVTVAAIDGTFTINRYSGFSSSVYGSLTGSGFVVTSQAGSITLVDVTFYREAAGIYAQRNLTSSQTYRIYNTWTDASNYERAKIEWSSNVLNIGTEKAGTGTARALALQTDGTARLSITAAGASTFSSTVCEQRVVTAVTTTATPATTDSCTVYTNEGDDNGATITLPTAAAGPQYTFVVQAAQTLTITAASGDTIRIGSSVTATAGSISSAVVGSVVTLQAINATEWVATAVVGSWSI